MSWKGLEGETRMGLGLEDIWGKRVRAAGRWRCGVALGHAPSRGALCLIPRMTDPPCEAPTCLWRFSTAPNYSLKVPHPAHLNLQASGWGTDVSPVEQHPWAWVPSQGDTRGGSGNQEVRCWGRNLGWVVCRAPEDPSTLEHHEGWSRRVVSPLLGNTRAQHT